MGGPRRPLQSHHKALIPAKSALSNGIKTKAGVKFLRAGVGGQRVNQDRFHVLTVETLVNCKCHHLVAKPATKVGFLANPDIDRTKIWPAIAPIVCFFLRRIDDQQDTNGALVKFSDQYLLPLDIAGNLDMPIHISVITGCGDDVIFCIPVLKYRDVG